MERGTPNRSAICYQERFANKRLGDVLDPPEPGGFAVTAVDWQGTEVGHGRGGPLAEALLRGQPHRATIATTLLKDRIQQLGS